MRVDDSREVVLRPNDATERGWGLQWRTNSLGMCDRGVFASTSHQGQSAIAFVGDSICAGWGVNADQRFELILEQVWDSPSTKDERSERRDHQLRRAGAFPGTTLVSLQSNRLAHGSGPRDLRGNRRGRGVG